MGSSDSGNRAFRVLRRHGAQPPFDIAAIATELAQCQGDDAALCALFDWSQVSSWPFQAPSAAAVRAWNSTVPPVLRAAIIHDQRWDKHAAVLSALMRIRDGQVRSFHSLDHEKAVAWLNL
jgi:stage II sporulation SpoAA-like protein